MRINLIKSSWGVKLIALVILMVPGLVHAASVYEGLLAAVGISGGLNIFGNIFGAPNIGEVVLNVVKFILGITGAAALLAIIIGGLRYVMSGGNEERIEGAKKTLTYAIIGFVVIILAYTILTLIDRIFLH